MSEVPGPLARYQAHYFGVAAVVFFVLGANNGGSTLLFAIGYGCVFYGGCSMIAYAIHNRR